MTSKRFPIRLLLIPGLSIIFYYYYSYLSKVLQQAGRNPSYATLNKYWTPRTATLNFDDFCEILKSERKIEETDLLRAFKKMDDNGDGYISHSELEKALTTVSSWFVHTLLASGFSPG